MASNLTSFENIDFADLTRNSEPCDPQRPNMADPMSYATEGRYGISVITDTSSWLCASGIHLAQIGTQVQESRTVSPKFATLDPGQEEAVIAYHSGDLAQYQREIDPALQALRDSKVSNAAQRVIMCGSRLLGGVYFKQEEDGLRGDIFFALRLAKELPLDAIKQEIAKRSFTASQLSEIFDRTRATEPVEEPVQRSSHLTVVSVPAAVAA